MDYRMAEMRKITTWMLGTDNKMVIFRWIAERIAVHGEHETWIVGESQQIKWGTLNFEGKAWWILARHKLYPIIRDDVLSSVWAAMISNFIAVYEFDIGKFLDREIRDKAVEEQKVLRAYPSILRFA
ncbi:hypothetical protein FXO38_10420 [Capsicum annuum]|nr:hypothetical protein FXO37_31002 [Capsicum annuum]KAF3663846.1 hypothetical protein FXO38_10420 [Capsicum annuum]